MSDINDKQSQPLDDPAPTKKIKLSRGRPKISTQSVISTNMKKYLERQAELIRVKFCFINREAPPLTQEQTQHIIQVYFGHEQAEQYLEIAQHKRNFLSNLLDPAQKGFIDECDTYILLLRFKETDFSDAISPSIVFPVYLEFLSDDMDKEAFEKMCRILKEISDNFEKNYTYGQEIQLSNLIFLQKADESLVYEFQTAFKTLLQDSLILANLKLRSKSSKSKKEL